MMSLARKARLESNLSVEEAAKELKISGGYLSQIENGKRQISEERAEQIAKLYGKKKEDIFLATRYAIRVVSESA